MRAARGGVIIELPPGEPEITPNTPPGASYVRRMGPIMCYADTTTETDNSADAATEAHQNTPDVIDAGDATTAAATV